MDLPTCPHCGQSVLDDDVDDCPFCGESLSGKPSGKPKPAPKKPEKAASKPAATETKAKPKPAPKKPEEKSAEPFAVDHAAMSNAIPLRPVPAKGRKYEVVCPMCEVVNYTSPKAGGKEVKCSNPKCLVPVFTCPEPPPEPVETPQVQPSGMSTAQLGLISTVALAAVGLGVWFFVLKDADPPKPPEFNAVKNPPADNPTEDPEAENKPPQEKTAQPPVPKGPNLVKLRANALDEMVAASIQNSRSASRPKELRIQGIALAYVDVGEIEQAKVQLDRLSKLSDPDPHYRVLPWVEIGWSLRKSGVSAENALKEASQFAQDVPSSTQESWKEAVALASLMVAEDRRQEAALLMQRKFGSVEDQQFWLDLLKVTLDKTFNLDALEDVRPLVPDQEPARSGVVWQLVFHEAGLPGLAWAKSAETPGVNSEALIAYGEAVVAKALANGQTVKLTDLTSEIDALPGKWAAITSARAHARIGQRYAAAGQQGLAAQMLKQAETALGKLANADAMAIPGLEELYKMKFPSTLESDAIAVAAFEVARLQASLNQEDNAWGSIEKGLASLRSQAPPVPPMEELAQKNEKEDDFVRLELQAALDLDSRDEISRAFRTYQKQTNQLLERAETRFRLQVELLSKATRWGLSPRIDTEITSATDNAGNDYFPTELPWVVMADLSESSKSPSEELKSGLSRRPKPKGLDLLESAKSAMKSNDIPRVISLIGRSNSSLPDTERRRWLLRLATQHVAAGQTEEAANFLLGLFSVNPFLGEDAAELIAAFATKSGQGETVWKVLKQRSSWPPTQKIAAYRGFVAAIEDEPKEPAPTP